MPQFDMVGYTPHRFVVIYPFKSLNKSRCIPTRPFRLCRMPGTGFSSELFSLSRMHSIFSSPDFSVAFFFVVCVPNLQAFMWSSIVGSQALRCRRTMYSVRPGQNAVD